MEQEGDVFVLSWSYSPFFFNRKDHKRYALTLAVRFFETPHTGRRILQLLKAMLSEYDNGIRNIGVVLTNNGSNMIKASKMKTMTKKKSKMNKNHEYESNEEDHVLAFTGFCERLGCLSHTLQLVMSEFDTIHSLKKVVKKAQD